MQPASVPSVLIEYGTNIVLAVTRSAPGLVFLNECTPETMAIFGVQYPNYRESFFLETTSPDEYPQWTWNFTDRTFDTTPAHLLTQHIIERSRLAVKKLEAFTAIASNISRTRLTYTTEILLQDTIYLAKKTEATSFRDSGYDITRIMEYPHVLLYADYAGISPQQAADEIIFKAKIATETLAKTELLRITYFNKIRAARHPDELASLLDAFYRDPYVAALG